MIQSSLTRRNDLRRRATIEFSPAFQGWDQAQTHNHFVASATVETFNRR